MSTGEIIYSFRRHWFIVLMNFIAILIAYLIPLGAAWAAFLLGTLPAFPIALLLYASVAWTIVIWCSLLLLWTHYYLNVWFITSHRVISIEQPAFFDRKIGSWEITNVQEVVAKEAGILQNLLHFGTLEIRTAGINDANETFRNVPNPNEIRDVILSQGNHFDRIAASSKRTEDLLHSVSNQVREYITTGRSA